jgi:hypothetical protein
MPRYMLDTDICSYIMKRSNDAVLKRLSTVPSQRCVHLCNHEVGTLIRSRGVSPAAAGCSGAKRLSELHPDPGLSRRRISALCPHTRRPKKAGRGDRNEDWSERPIHRRPRPQPRLDVSDQQYARVWAGLQVGHRELDALARGAYRDFPAVNTVVCRLTASIEAMERRVQIRDSGISQRESVARVAKLNVILDCAIRGLCCRQRESLADRGRARNAGQSGMDLRLNLTRKPEEDRRFSLFLQWFPIDYI